MRLAGTSKQYSKNAIPQLTKTTAHTAWDLNFRCPYQATVINKLEAHSKIIGFHIYIKGAGIAPRPAQISHNKCQFPAVIAEHGHNRW